MIFDLKFLSIRQQTNEDFYEFSADSSLNSHSIFVP